MLHRQITPVLLGGLMVLGSVRSAHAQGETATLKDDALKKATMTQTATTVPDGWTVKLNVGGSFNLTINNQAANDSGLGQNRANIQFGLVTGFDANLKQGNHGWDNKLTMQIGFTTQFIDDGVGELDTQTDKTQDLFEFLSTYVYRLDDPDWLGPFARVRFISQVLPSDVPNPNFDPSMPIDDDNLERLELTKSFSPITLRESAGFFAKPVDDADVTVDAKLGAGAEQIFGRGGNVLTGGVLTEIMDTNSVGAEGDLAMKGVLRKDFATWTLGVNVFVPFVTNADANVLDEDGTPLLDEMGNNITEKATGLDYTNLIISGALSFKLSKYLSLDLTGLVRRQPLVVRPIQVQAGILISAGFDVL